MYDREFAAAFQYEAPQTIGTDSFAVDQCTDTAICEMDGVELEGRGRIVELCVRLRNVCPGKRTALGILLHETGENGLTQPRGMKTLTVPAHNEDHACDVLVRGIRFVLPEDLSLSPNGTQRQFHTHTTAHYIDVDTTSSCPVPCRRR